MPEDAVKRLQVCGFNPTNVLDVGANVGAWSKVYKGVFPAANFFMVEGNDKCQGELAASGVPFEISLVGRAEGNITYHRRKDGTCAGSTGNSVFKENTHIFTDDEVVVSRVRTIDNIVATRQVGPFQFMKVDIQGSEVPALLGARHTLETVDVVLTEAPIMNYNQGSPPFTVLTSVLNHLGFEIFDIADMARSEKGLLMQMDVLWVRRTSALWGPGCTGYPVPSHFTHNGKHSDWMP
ncbi:hypothetical protein HXX76_015798 [Chlamydomonas incerta]|uniref:Methyltransferase FkbM domain-containing protein n=1 Tax=Chlamydomonas incerta TaxID=51695 RepID=A0A835SG45_CHLIN|nr:hypothetical protein HXX76_015798 [Chlamydomonas incerta]|eukprot:KAG2422778.1 hypothetical protein HXX76_015798 [Chlamydomonas incerta]